MADAVGAVDGDPAGAAAATAVAEAPSPPPPPPRQQTAPCNTEDSLPMETPPVTSVSSPSAEENESTSGKSASGGGGGYAGFGGLKFSLAKFGQKASVFGEKARQAIVSEAKQVAADARALAEDARTIVRDGVADTAALSEQVARDAKATGEQVARGGDRVKEAARTAASGDLWHKTVDGIKQGLKTAAAATNIGDFAPVTAGHPVETTDEGFWSLPSTRANYATLSSQSSRDAFETTSEASGTSFTQRGGLAKLVPPQDVLEKVQKLGDRVAKKGTEVSRDVLRHAMELGQKISAHGGPIPAGDAEAKASNVRTDESSSLPAVASPAPETPAAVATLPKPSEVVEDVIFDIGSDGVDCSPVAAPAEALGSTSETTASGKAIEKSQPPVEVAKSLAVEEDPFKDLFDDVGISAAAPAADASSATAATPAPAAAPATAKAAAAPPAASANATDFDDLWDSILDEDDKK
eukprot:TRINITY_DN13428_c0_g1_i4.p1 TRINITY_DN13428_c0_g1~~TRINITY_DN13428_c0_g1_i4.p1  ORF type:complete len:467 (-),score=143.19 TRINITY_DN13428_c0_g1_i4:142-1542(-)